MSTSAVHANRASDQQYIKQTLAERPLFFIFPPVMEAGFLNKRVEASLYYIRSGQWLLLLMFALIIAVAWFRFQELLAADHFLLLKFVEFPVGATILFIIYGNRIPRVHAHFHQVMFPAATFQIVLINLLIFQSSDSGYYIYAIINQMISMLLVALGLRFTTRVLTLLYTVGGVLGLTLGLLMQLPVDLLAFGYYYVLYGVVVVALAGIAERQERFSFLQELMVSHQSKELAELNRQLDRIAHHDALTGIPNRRSFDIASEREWEIALREQRSLSMLLLDVDFFKRYNDTYGHDSGDQCLKTVAQAIRDTMLRPADLAARYGGEEFVVLMPDTDAAGAAEVAERILQAVEACGIPHASSSAAPHVTVSIGITTLLPVPGQPLKDAIRQADEALYQAKENGRRQFRVFRHAQREEALED
jgi:diguanylate cyclase (GGDEF)-like protein